jgi:soluble cytochrome b562
MWKKLEEFASVPPEPTSSSQEDGSVTQMLMNAIRDSSHAKKEEKKEEKTGPELKADPYEHTFQEYAEAVDQFTKSAKEFIRYAPLLSEARQAYEKLRTASERIRRSLESDEKQFRTLMDLAQDQAKLHLAPTGSSLEGTKPPKSCRPEPFVVNSDGKKIIT